MMVLNAIISEIGLMHDHRKNENYVYIEARGRYGVHKGRFPIDKIHEFAELFMDEIDWDGVFSLNDMVYHPCQIETNDEENGRIKSIGTILGSNDLGEFMELDYEQEV